VSGDMLVMPLCQAEPAKDTVFGMWQGGRVDRLGTHVLDQHPAWQVHCHVTLPGRACKGSNSGGRKEGGKDGHRAMNA
jgi:hypothetical protein